MTESGKQGLNPATTYRRTYPERLTEESVGLCGELAVARHCGVEDWVPGLNTFHNTPDVGEFEVRATARRDGRLIIRPGEPMDRHYWLVTFDKDLDVIIRGHIKGIDAQRDEWLDNPNDWRPAWFVPQSALTKPKI
jgi:hypothetical protein